MRKIPLLVPSNAPRIRGVFSPIFIMAPEYISRAMGNLLYIPTSSMAIPPVKNGGITTILEDRRRLTKLAVGIRVEWLTGKPEEQLITLFFRALFCGRHHHLKRISRGLY